MYRYSSIRSIPGASRFFGVLAAPFVALFIVLLFVLLLTACNNGGPEIPTASPPPSPSSAHTPTNEHPTAAESSTDPYTTVYGERLPDDAAPYDQQIYKVACDLSRNQITFDFAVSVYQRICLEEGKLNDLFQDQLVTFDKDFNVIPASAESWEMSDDGLTWTFHIKPGLMWSDGTPLTAYDWEATYRLIASPEHAWDFAWFYSGILENWAEVQNGELPPDALGVRAIDDLTLVFTTETPQPAFPSMMQNSYVLQKRALETHGPDYNSRVETSVSSGPFLLEEYQPLVRIELVANPHYRGYRKPKLKRLIGEYRDMNTAFFAFQHHEIDYLSNLFLHQEDYQTIEGTPLLKENYFSHYGEFRTDYFFFDTYRVPFNNLNVRKAFAHALDRERIVQEVFGPMKAIPAYSMLMPGFPGADTEGRLRPYQEYDCPKAQEFLAAAGYPEGQGFPPLEMYHRNEPAALQAVYRAASDSISECLNIPIRVSTKDYKVFMDWLTAEPTKLQFGVVSYGMDYIDPSNLLGVWASTGRHSWRNEEYDRLVREASSLTGDPQRRIDLFQEAERILVDDVGGVFLTHRLAGDLIQPYLAGDGFRQPDAQGRAGWHWGNDWAIGETYISQDVENYRTYREKIR